MSDIHLKAEEGAKHCEEMLSKEAEPEIERASKLIESSDAVRIKEAVGILNGALNVWPENPKAKEAMTKAHDALNKLAMQYIMKADTLRGLSGCKEALPQYRTALGVAAFKEVPAYGRAEAGIMQCS